MTCEKPSCKTPAERKQVRQRGDGLSKNQNPAGDKQIHFPQSSDEMYAIYTQNKYLQFLFFFFFKSNLLHNKYVGETWRTGENKNRFCFIRTKALWSYRIITYIHYFRDRSTY